MNPACKPRRLTGAMAAGFSLIEFAVVAALIGFLAAKLLRVETTYQEQAEKTAMEQMLGTLRSALHLEMANLITKGNPAGVAKLADQNPMDWLAEKPKNYAGVFYAPAPGLVNDGSWYFDMQGKTLVYLVNNAAHLNVADGSRQLRFRAKVVADAGREGSSGNEIRGVVLEPVTKYSWF